MAHSKKTSKEFDLFRLRECQEVNVVSDSDAGITRLTQDTETPSGRSRSRQSHLCAEDAAWVIWSTNHRHVFTEQEWASDGSKDLQSRTKYPRYFKNKEFTTLLGGLLSKDQLEKDGVMHFQSWIKKLKAKQLIDGDQCDFDRWLSAICVNWKFMVHNTDSASNESNDRLAVDNLIALAFQLRDDSDHTFRTQAPLIVPPDCLVADAIATMDLSRDWAQEIKGIKDKYVFSWAWQNSAMRLKPNILTFVFEAKHDNLTVVLRQLIMDFYGAQLHRRALRMKDGPVFGAILDNGELKLYVSYWDADKLVVDAVFHPFELRDFGRFVECYFALCRIADYQKEWLEKELKRWDENAEEQRQNLEESAEKPWRDDPNDPRDRGTKRGFEDDGPQGGGKRSAAGSGEKAVDEANRLATSIVNGILSPENVYLPTEVNMLAFDLVTSAKQSEDDYRVSGPAIWAGRRRSSSKSTGRTGDTRSDPSTPQPGDDEMGMGYSLEKAAKKVTTADVEMVESDHGDLDHESRNGTPVIACGGDFFSAHASPNINVC